MNQSDNKVYILFMLENKSKESISMMKQILILRG